MRMKKFIPVFLFLLCFSSVCATNSGVYYISSNSANYKASVKTPPNLQINCPNTTYGEPYSVTITNNLSTETPTLSYKVRNASDVSYTETPPVNADIYKVRAIVPENEFYDADTVTLDFQISKAQGELSVIINDIFYGGEIITSPTSNSGASISYRYKRYYASDLTYSVTLPTDTGLYVLRATLASNMNYTADTFFTTFEIKRIIGNISISQNDVFFGGNISPNILKNNTNGLTQLYYKHYDSAISQYSTTKPVNVGHYDVRGIMFGDAYYTGDTSNVVDFFIKKVNGVIIIACNDITYGQTVNPTITSNTNTNLPVTFFYKPNGSPDNYYTTTSPSNAGVYIVRATVGEAENYSAAVSAPVSFRIKKGRPAYSIPDSIKAVEDYPLHEYAPLPAQWQWLNPSDTARLGGTYQFYAAIFTPTDTLNYDTAHTFIHVYVMTKEDAGIKIETSFEYISIYPNPTTGVVYINNSDYNYNSTSNKYNKLSEEYVIYNNIGKLILKTYQPVIDLSNYPNGVYFLKTSKETVKIIKY
ncbi:hypothetical protein FACS1894153_1200 [Bacteroidia bacterium]|nr:hypothetical protein FACS1894153_1200 [Bacteroidia bacterium]